MKQIYILLILILSAAAVAAAPVNTLVVNNGDWNTDASWSLTRVPVDGDTVVIPAGYTVIIGATPDYTASTLYIKVYGTLSLLQSARFDLGVNSLIRVYPGGTVHGDLLDNDPGNGTIYIGGVKKFSDAGRRSITGPVYASSATGADPNGFASFAVLPVVFTHFTAIRNSDNTVELAWTTAQEINNKHYVVERSTNSTDWTEIAIVLPGNNASVNSYRYNDKNTAAPATYYRIMQVDLDGKYMYSDIKVIRTDAGKNNTSIFTANKNITIRLGSEVKSQVAVRLINMAGNVILQQSIDNPSASITFSAGNALSGIYVVQVVDNNGLITAKKVVLN